MILSGQFMLDKVLIKTNVIKICLDFLGLRESDCYSVCTAGSLKTWKVMKFYEFIFQAWKVMEFRCGSWKVMENDVGCIK